LTPIRKTACRVNWTGFPHSPRSLADIRTHQQKCLQSAGIFVGGRTTHQSEKTKSSP
jgi:hypothetical protein